MINTTYIKKSQESETLIINEQSKLKEAEGQTIFKFGFGQSPFLPPKNVVSELVSNVERKEYVNVQGIKELREAVASFHNHYESINIDPENVIVGPGSKMLIYSILAAFNEADVFIVTPSWVSYEPQAHLAKLDVTRIETNFESRWRLTPELLEEACKNRQDKERPIVLIFNYPGNPDGLSYTADELRALATVFRENKIIVISDEIYGFLNHSASHLSMAQFYPEGTIVTTGLSKWCGAGGWRIGVALMPSSFNDTLKNTIIGIASETYSCAATPMQYAAVKAYEVSLETENYLAHQRRILNLAGNYVYEQLKKAGVNIYEPEGGFYLNPDFSSLKETLNSRGITTSDELCASLLKDKSVALLPGSVFGYKKEQLTARLAYVDFNGVEALKASEEIGLETPLDHAFLEKWCPKVIEGADRIFEWLK